MAIIDLLLRTSYEDTQLLMKNDALGDNFSIPRDVDFLLTTTEEQKASVVCSFINDNKYGVARVEKKDVRFNVVVVVHMPVEQNILTSISGLMLCVSHLFGVEYDGWGCALKRTHASHEE
jgi:hypothetical protein